MEQQEERQQRPPLQERWERPYEEQVRSKRRFKSEGEEEEEWQEEDEDEAGDRDKEHNPQGGVEDEDGDDDEYDDGEQVEEVDEDLDDEGEAGDYEDDDEEVEDDRGGEVDGEGGEDKETTLFGRWRQTFPSRNGEISWSSQPYEEEEEEDDGEGRGRPSDVPGVGRPTAYAASCARDIVSTFRLFVTPEIARIVLEETNREGLRTHGLEGWREMDEVDLEAYVGLLILVGVYRSRGEAAASLWDAETGRPIFRATMPLKTFESYSRLVRFDDRETRAERRASDKLAAVREVWDAWVQRLPLLYEPGPHVTVDEQLLPFRGRCLFRQYIRDKPAKYGIKVWAACDSRSSYAWKLQLYTGEPTGGRALETNQRARVVLDLTEGLRGRNITCDNFFTSYELAHRLFHERDCTLLGAVRKNKPELPAALLELKGRRKFSSKFAFAPGVALVSYVPKPSKNVLLLSTFHARSGAVAKAAAEVALSRADGKPSLVLDYNANKGGVDILDKVVAAYSCRRMTARWPLAVFHNVIDVSAYNAFVLWRELHPGWMYGKSNRRRLFLEQLGKTLVAPLIWRREHLPRAEPAAALVMASRGLSTPLGGRPTGDAARPPPLPASKRKRCRFCPPRRKSKTHAVCRGCEKYICKGCTFPYCPACCSFFPLGLPGLATATPGYDP